MPTAARDVLGLRMQIVCEHAELLDYFDRLYEAFPVAPDTEHLYDLREADGEFQLWFDDEVIAHAADPEGLVANVVHHLNREVAVREEHVLIHAGGVARNGVGVILPAVMESGKTTLTAGLVRAGFAYLTDEAVPIRRSDAAALPYPKPLSLDEGSWYLFPEFEPHEPFATNGYKQAQWQVPPGAIRAGAVAGECRIRYVVFPEFRAGAATELVPITRAEGLIELTKNTFRFDQQGRPTFEVLGRVIRDAECFRLPNGSLDGAVDLVSRLVEQSG